MAVWRIPWAVDEEDDESIMLDVRTIRVAATKRALELAAMSVHDTSESNTEAAPNHDDER